MFIQPTKIKDVKVEIGQLVKAFRKREKISQQDLAVKLDISRLTIQLKVVQHFDLLSPLNQFLKAKREEEENSKSLY
jgi:transcriptional regulator with XRE-family HTH domain